jgi:hypothetical protein
MSVPYYEAVRRMEFMEAQIGDGLNIKMQVVRAEWEWWKGYVKDRGVGQYIKCPNLQEKR